MVVLSRRGTVAGIADRLIETLLVVDPLVFEGASGSVARALEDYLSVRISPQLIQAAIERLERASRIVTSSGKLAAAASVRGSVERAIQESTELEIAVRDHWFAELGSSVGDAAVGTELWECLQDFISRAFLKHGAEAALLLSPDVPLTPSFERSISGLLEDASKSACRKLSPDLARAHVRRFFETADETRARYISQLMDGAFTLFALSIDAETSSYLKAQLPRLELFVDTNFIFGMLGLNQGAPEIELASELVEIIQRNKFPFTLYYHQETLGEIERTLDAVESRLVSRRWQGAISRAAVRVKGLTGIERKYHELNAEHPTDPLVFLSKYRAMRILLEDRGFKIYRTRPPDELEVLRRGELVARYEEYLKQRVPTRPKPYAVMNHDITVWLAVQERRKRAKSVLNSRALFLTMDYRFFAFDWERLRDRGEAGSVALPRQLLQVLRPFAAIDYEFDRRFVQAFSTPEIRSLGAVPADTTASVLSYLNAYQDLPEATAVRILSNEILLAGLAKLEGSSTEFAAAIDTALADENRVLLEEREAMARETMSVRSDLERERELRVAAEKAAAGKHAETQLVRTELTATQADRMTTVATFQERLASAEHTVQRLRLAAVLAAWLLGALLLGPGLFVGLHSVGWDWPDQSRFLVSLLVVWSALVWAFLDSKRRPVSLGALAVGVVVVLIETLPQLPSQKP